MQGGALTGDDTTCGHHRNVTLAVDGRTGFAGWQDNLLLMCFISGRRGRGGGGEEGEERAAVIVIAEHTDSAARALQISNNSMQISIVVLKQWLRLNAPTPPLQASAIFALIII